MTEYPGLELTMPPAVITEPKEVKTDVMPALANGETVVFGVLIAHSRVYERPRKFWKDLAECKRLS